MACKGEVQSEGGVRCLVSAAPSSRHGTVQLRHSCTSDCTAMLHNGPKLRASSKIMQQPNAAALRTFPA